MKKFVRVNLYLPKELVEWLRQQAQAEDRSLNNYIKRILEYYKSSK